MILDKYPRADLHEMNLDWLLKTVKYLQNTVENLNVDEIIKELIEDGTIYDHFGLYFSRYYKSYADMMADDELQNDMFVFCFGAANPFDGGECYFHIIDSAGDALTCQNGLYAYPEHSRSMSIVPYVFITGEIGQAVNMAQAKGVTELIVPAGLDGETVTTQIDLLAGNSLIIDKDCELFMDEPLKMHGATVHGGEITTGANLSTQSVIHMVEGTNRVERCNINVLYAGKIGIGCIDGKGVVSECHIYGNDTGQYGIWGEQPPAEYIMDIRNTTIDHFYQSAIYTQARSFFMEGCLIEYNFVRTSPSGGGQIYLEGGNTQGYNEIMNCQIKNPGGNLTEAITLNSSANAIIHGNYIHNQGSTADGILIKSGCFADIYDNTLHGKGIHLSGNYAKVNTHDNWYASIVGDNILIDDATQSGAIKEKRFTGDLLNITAAVKPIFDVEGSTALKEHIPAGQSIDIKMYEDDVFTLIDMATSEMVMVFATTAGNHLMNGTLTNVTLTNGSGQINVAASADADVYIYRS